MPMMSGGALLSRLTFTCIVYLYSVCFDLLATTASNFKMYTLKKLCGHRLSKLSDSILFGESQVRQAVSRRFHVKGQETLEYLCECVFPPGKTCGASPHLFERTPYGHQLMVFTNEESDLLLASESFLC